MKKVFPLFFLAIFLFNTAGYYVVFKAQQYQIKNEIASSIKAGIYTSELTTIAIPTNELSSIEWMESGEEMNYKGQLYDVVKSTKTPNSVTYYCINDSKESSLFSCLTDHINKHVASNVPQKDSKKVVDNDVQLYFSTLQSLGFTTNISTQHFSSKKVIFTSTIIEKNAPPPEFV